VHLSGHCSAYVATPLWADSPVTVIDRPLAGAGCYVFDCGEEYVEEVYATLGQAFKLAKVSAAPDLGDR